MNMGLLKCQFIRNLNDLCGRELELLNVLPQMADLAQSPDLKSAFRDHFQKTREHVQRLKQILVELGERPAILKWQDKGETIRPEEHRLQTRVKSTAIDAVLIAAAQNMEHYEFSGYILAINCAQILCYHTAADLLMQALNEEYEASRIQAEIDQVMKSTESGADRSAEKSGYAMFTAFLAR
jgi:ferritin-like metal-binding protein YciE